MNRPVLSRPACLRGGRLHREEPPAPEPGVPALAALTGRVPDRLELQDPSAASVQENDEGPALATENEEGATSTALSWCSRLG